MTSGAVPDNPFVAAGMIEDPRLFVGRKDELYAIASRMKGDQPTSINIVGDKHIGKSSLLHYFVRTWQQRVLHISGIAVDILNRCQRLSDIVDIANQLAWIPSPPPKELGKVLPQFLDISQNVRASEQATSPYRKYELLNIPINALRQLGQSLALTKNARVAVSFGNIAQSWLTILETAQHTLNEQAQQSKEI
ncbi:MAG: hypothetical protein V7K89_16045 [Nostoc sp.]|uniref:hypothetical protein n=1 Tax=Nostoc sp. TaxID=1180 RepID=UPI002FF8DBAD